MNVKLPKKLTWSHLYDRVCYFFNTVMAAYFSICYIFAIIAMMVREGGRGGGSKWREGVEGGGREWRQGERKEGIK